MDKGTWQATVQRVAKIQTQLKQLSSDISLYVPGTPCWEELRVLEGNDNVGDLCHINTLCRVPNS